MDKKHLSFIALAIVSIFLSSCGNSLNTPTETIESLEKISEAIESGESMKSTIKMSGEELGVPMNMAYWIKGNDIRVESEVNGMAQTMIQKDEITYMNPQNIYGKDSDCNWISINTSENKEELEDEADFDYDYEKFENDPAYTIKCSPESFGSEKFAVSGKVCTMDDMVKDMMGDFNIEGLDMGNLDAE